MIVVQNSIGFRIAWNGRAVGANLQHALPIGGGQHSALRRLLEIQHHTTPTSMCPALRLQVVHTDSIVRSHHQSVTAYLLYAVHAVIQNGLLVVGHMLEDSDSSTCRTSNVDTT